MGVSSLDGPPPVGRDLPDLPASSPMGTGEWQAEKVE
jgi:hypothetical protein